MLDIQLLRSNTAAVAERLAARGYEFDTARFNALEEQRKAVQVKTEELQASRNSISKQIGALKGQGKHEEAQAAMDQVTQIKADLEQAAADLDAVQKELDAWLLSIPNLPHESVPVTKLKTLKSAKWARRANLILKSKTMLIWASLWAWILKAVRNCPARALPS